MSTYNRKYIDRIAPRNVRHGVEQRLSYQDTITKDQPLTPKPVTYEDIDKSVIEFMDKSVVINVQGVGFPTFRLFSNQRFSEYSQTWEHTDENGNLIVNFKTVNRESNPKPGRQQGNFYNIPGDRWYEYLRRDVLEDNGDETTEVYSIRQPFAVDFVYKLNVVVSKFEYLNMFNTRIQDLFKSRQCYIRPNGHFLPMVLEDISDESEHEISERKFFSQSYTVRVMGYITRPEDLRITKYPKRVSVSVVGTGTFNGKRERVAVYEDDSLEDIGVEIVLDFPSGVPNTLSFVMDTEMRVSEIETDNVRSFSLSVDGIPVEQDTEFVLFEGMDVKTSIRKVDNSVNASMTLSGTSLRCKEKQGVDMSLCDVSVDNDNSSVGDE